MFTPNDPIGAELVTLSGHTLRLIDKTQLRDGDTRLTYQRHTLSGTFVNVESILVSPAGATLCSWCNDEARHLIGTYDASCSSHYRQYIL